MTQPLNYTPKAIVDLTAMAVQAKAGTPLSSAGIFYLVDKLRQAQVFVLSDGGQLLDRSKPRPELPGIVLRPPFPVVALEYQANPTDWKDPIYTASPCSRRIALAWDYTDDLPPLIEGVIGRPLAPGVVMASIAYYDEHQQWMPIAVAAHVGYDESWEAPQGHSDYQTRMIAAGRIAKAMAEASGLAGSTVPICPEAIYVGAATLGVERTMDMMSADLADEIAAYMDLCWALACKNVSTRSSPAPEKLNRQRLKAGKPPLFGFHVLELAGDTLVGADGEGAADRNAPRAHLRRGHIRRLNPERVTWVNQTMVRGRGFVDKVYAA